MIGGRCAMAMRISLAAQGAQTLPKSILGRLAYQNFSTSSLPTKQAMKGFTIKDKRPPRTRVAKEERQQYLAQRKAAFQVEQDKAISCGLGWGIRSAIALERLPVIMEDFTDWQMKFWDLQVEQSRYAPRFPAEMGFKYDKEPMTLKQIMEKSPVPLSSRRTPADEANDRSTLDRALDDRLLLIVKPTPESSWRLPDSAWEAGETIRQAAERTARQLLVKTATIKGQPNDVSQLHFVGNCPAGWLWRTADEEQWSRTGNFGDKVFINRVQLICGEPNLVEGKAANHLWVTKDEIGEYLGDAEGVYIKHMI